MASIQLWKNKETSELDPRLFSEIAENIAKAMATDGANKRNTNTQLRRFFDELNRLNNQSELSCSDWNLILPQVHMLVAKAAYAQGRDLVTKAFVDLIRDCVKQVSERRDLKVFATFFEAFMGFDKIHGPK
jgi:CRISPR-associated protein Csm2